MPFLFLKRLLASRLTLVRLSTLFCFWSFDHCILTCFLWSKNLNILHKNLVHAAVFVRYRNPLAEIFIFSLMFSQNPFTSSLAFMFSKAPKLFEILIWHCFLISSLLTLLLFHILFMCCLFIYYQYSPNVVSTR
jgi:hypothetical protein